MALQGSGQTEEQQASNRAASPEPEGVEPQKPERGLTFNMRGDARAQPLWRPLDGRVRPQLIHISNLANSPVNRFMFA